MEEENWSKGCFVEKAGWGVKHVIMVRCWLWKAK